MFTDKSIVTNYSLSLTLRCVHWSVSMVTSPTQVYSSFLDILMIFVELKTQNLDDWLFVLLLRLIHKQSEDNLSSVAQKLTMVSLI